MNENKNILKLLEDDISSKILFTIFVYGSEEGKWLTQKDIKAILYPKGSGQSSTVFNDLNKTKLFFDYGSEERFVCKYIFDKDVNKEVPYTIVKNKMTLNWIDKKKNNWVYIPKLNWLEELYPSIKLTAVQKDYLYNYFKTFNYRRVPSSRFSYDLKNNILDLIKRAYEMNCIFDFLGRAFFGEQLESAREKFNNLKFNAIKKRNLKSAIKKICEECSLNLKLNSYNEALLSWILRSINNKDIMDIANIDVIHFPELSAIFASDIMQKETPKGLQMFTPTDILLIALLNITPKEEKRVDRKKD